MSLYIKKGSNNIYFSDLIILIDKNGAPYCIFTTLDSFEVGDVLILYINDTEYVRFKVYRIKEFKEMGEPIYYQIIALHLSDWEWKTICNPDGFEIGVQKDWSDGTRTIKLYITSLDAMNLSLLKIKTTTPTTIPTNAPVLDANLKCDGNTDALTTKMGTSEPYSILIKDSNKVTIIYDSQITNEIDVSSWIPFESYEKWTDPSGTTCQSQIKYYISEGHFTTFYYAGEKYDDGTNTGTINTLILYNNKTEIYDTFNPSISRVQMTGTSATREGRKFGSGTYATLDFTDLESCATFKKNVTSWASGENDKKTINFLVPQYLAKDESGNKIKSTKLLFRFMDSSAGFPGNNISNNNYTFYIKVYKNGTYQETLSVIKNYQFSAVIKRPTGLGDYSGQWHSYPTDYQYYQSVDEEVQNGDTDYIYVRYFSELQRIYFTAPNITKGWAIGKIRNTMYARYYISDYPLGEGKLSLNINNTQYDGTLNTFTTTWTEYYYEWSTNPATNNKWTWSDINNLQFGLKARGTSTFASAMVTQVFLSIYSENHYGLEYTITNNDLYTFEFYHNESSTLQNINIIGLLINFEVI